MVEPAMPSKSVTDRITSPESVNGQAPVDEGVSKQRHTTFQMFMSLFSHLPGIHIRRPPGIIFGTKNNATPTQARKDSIFTNHEARRAALKSSISSPILSIDQLRPLAYSTTMHLNPQTRTLFASINATRRLHDRTPLLFAPHLAEHAQNHASTHLGPATAQGVFSRGGEGSSRRTRVEHALLPTGNLDQPLREGVRLVSPPGMGALACGEMWFAGKYKPHRYGPEAPRSHAPDCACLEWLAFNIVVNRNWRFIGIGKAGDGSWVVEFCGIDEE